MSWIKLVGMTTTIVLITNLGGCALLKTRAETRARCANAPVLYSNLTLPSQDRYYQLADGTDCSDYYPGYHL